MEYLRAPTQAFFKAGRADGHDHEFLYVDGVGRVCAAVEYVHHRNGKTRRRATAYKAVKRDVERACRGFGGGDGNSEYRIRAELGLVVRAVRIEHELIDFVGVESVRAAKRLVDNGVDVDGFGNALAAVTRLVAVAKLYRLEFARRRARRGRASSDNAVLKLYFRFYRGIAARVDYFSADNLFDLQFRHGFSFFKVFCAYLIISHSVLKIKCLRKQ